MIISKEHLLKSQDQRFTRYIGKVDSKTIQEQDPASVGPKQNKNYYVVSNAGCARSRYTLTLSHIFLNQLIN